MRVLECDIYIYGDIRRENTDTLLFFFSFLEEGRRVSHFFFCVFAGHLMDGLPVIGG